MGINKVRLQNMVKSYWKFNVSAEPYEWGKIFYFKRVLRTYIKNEINNERLEYEINISILLGNYYHRKLIIFLRIEFLFKKITHQFPIMSEYFENKTELDS